MNVLTHEDGRFFYEHALDGGKTARTLTPIIKVDVPWHDLEQIDILGGQSLHITWNGCRYTYYCEEAAIITGIRVVGGQLEVRKRERPQMGLGV